MGGGGGVINAVSTVATAISAPIVGTVALAKEAAGSDLTAKIDSTPVVGTVSKGITSSGELYGDVATAVSTGNTKELKSDLVSSAKMGVVVGGAYLGGLAAEGVLTAGGGVLAGASATDTLLKKGLTPSALASFGEGLGYLPSGTSNFVDSLPGPKPGPVKPPQQFPGGGSGYAKDGTSPVYANGKSSGDYTMLFVAAVAVAFLYLKGV